MKTRMITQAELKSLLSYDPETGIFRWRVTPARNVCVGDVAGKVYKKTRYCQITINEKRYYAHRLAWLYIYGEFPDEHIDHINGGKTDNRINNLRPATRSQNLKNQEKHSNNTSGYKGVCWDKSKQKWKAYGRLNGKSFHLGYFDTREEAWATYQMFGQKQHGQFYRGIIPFEETKI